MSLKRWAGFLEAWDCIAQNAVAKQRLKRSGVYHVAGSAENLVDVEFQPRVFEDAHGALFVKINEYVDIAVAPGLSSSHRAEYSGVAHTQSSQLIFVIAERAQDVFEGSYHLQDECTRSWYCWWDKWS